MGCCPAPLVSVERGNCEVVGGVAGPRRVDVEDVRAWGDAGGPRGVPRGERYQQHSPPKRSRMRIALNRLSATIRERRISPEDYRTKTDSRPVHPAPGHLRTPEGQRSQPHREGPPGGPGGRPPGKALRARAERRRRRPSMGRRRVATGANHPASHSSAFRRGPGTPVGCSDGGPEHRYECYTETPPYVSRPNYECISGEVLSVFALVVSLAVVVGSPTPCWRP